MVWRNGHDRIVYDFKSESFRPNADGTKRRRGDTKLQDVLAHDFRLQPHRSFQIAQHGMIRDADGFFTGFHHAAISAVFRTACVSIARNSFFVISAAGP
jgi:hypothetical protein